MTVELIARRPVRGAGLPRLLAGRGDLRPIGLLEHERLHGPLPLPSPAGAGAARQRTAADRSSSSAPG